MHLVKFKDRRPWQTMFDELFTDELFATERASNLMKPATNVKETTDAFVMELAVPGFTKDDFKINVEQGVLTISSEFEKENKVEEDNYTRKEFQRASFKRSFSLPKTVNTENISANYINGVLAVTLGKKEEAKPLPPKTIVID